MMSTTLKIPRMCTDFHRVMRQQNDEIRYAEFQQQAMMQLMEWKVVDEQQQKNFNLQILENIDRLRTLDQHNSVFLNEQKIKDEVKSKQNQPSQNELTR